MSSGFGLRGGQSRCFGEFQRYMECYTSAKTQSPAACTGKVDDYFECLHHRKERLRVQLIKQELLNHKNSSKDDGSLKSVVDMKSSLPEVLGLVQ
ncbi:hypothetical protein DASC09_060640 [Saccharomycopsis crataegensis]|uniref:NADH dehydrogenase [ubiquinone] iron-sulfur protein 5 n=1 Tax=Saccharomycopsis crataegensis TaxID=43959 RepID=A0AAV5QUT8_9ASCO|nr:hypothetical protein DASC09_060640 [Saccharomycopsis crataegensis]